MRVLMAIAEMGTGGAETVVDDLTRRLAASSHRVVVASDGGWREEALRRDGVAETVRVPLREPGPVSLARAAARVSRVARRPRPDVVHAHNVRATLAARLGTTGPGRPPLVSTVHGLAPREYPRAAQVLGRAADRVVAVSTSVRDDLVGAGLDPRRVLVVENAAQPVERLDAALARRQLDLPAGVLVGLCAARLAPPKRHDLLIRAWAEATLDGILLIAGAGPHHEGLVDQIRELDLGDRVRLLGSRPDVARLLAAADVAVLPSDREGLPMAVLEAMGAGVPVVASDVGGLSGLVGAVELVEPGSALALTRGLQRVTGDTQHAERLVGAAERLVRARFSSSVMYDAYLSVYADLVVSSDEGVGS